MRRVSQGIASDNHHGFLCSALTGPTRVFPWTSLGHGHYLKAGPAFAECFSEIGSTGVPVTCNKTHTHARLMRLDWMYTENHHLSPDGGRLHHHGGPLVEPLPVLNTLLAPGCRQPRTHFLRPCRRLPFPPLVSRRQTHTAGPPTGLASFTRLRVFRFTRVAAFL